MQMQVKQLKQKIAKQLSLIYQDISLHESYDEIAQALIDIMEVSSNFEEPAPFTNHWSEEDVILITYGDTIIGKEQSPLHALKAFLDQHIKKTINSVHILPFFPYSSDDGFAVIDYSSVNESLGTWQNIDEISHDYRLMSDLVINHCSSRSVWFDNFIKGKGIGHDFFFTALPDDDLSPVVRPRTSPLLKEVETGNGKKICVVYI
jgi:sucrose phosphorylase